VSDLPTPEAVASGIFDTETNGWAIDRVAAVIRSERTAAEQRGFALGLAKALGAVRELEAPRNGPQLGDVREAIESLAPAQSPAPSTTEGRAQAAGPAALAWSDATAGESEVEVGDWTLSVQRDVIDTTGDEDGKRAWFVYVSQSEGPFERIEDARVEAERIARDARLLASPSDRPARVGAARCVNADGSPNPAHDTVAAVDPGPVRHWRGSFSSAGACGAEGETVEVPQQATCSDCLSAAGLPGPMTECPTCKGDGYIPALSPAGHPAPVPREKS
jgi:hypothetical protein